jgi:hypothetical protein
MARFLKNPDLSSGSLAAKLPVVPSSAYGDIPTDGLIRFNTSNAKMEMFFNSQWNQVAKIGAVSITVDEFTGDNLITSFTMSQSESNPNSIVVQIGGVYQQPITNYTVSGTTITFTSPPPAPGVNPNKIVVIHNLNSTDAA